MFNSENRKTQKESHIIISPGNGMIIIGDSFHYFKMFRLGYWTFWVILDKSLNLSEI